MMKLYQKSELTFAIACIVGYVLIAGNLRAQGDDSPAMAIGLFAVALVLFLFVQKNGLLEKYGLDRWATNSRQMLYSVPLWIVSSGNLWGGISPYYQGLGLVCAMVSFALVGFVEELIFRGFLFRAMLKDGNEKMAIVISSVTFGMGHIVNLLTGHALAETLVQIVFAVAIGFIFTMVYYKCGSLLPLILAHSIIDVFSVFAVDNAAIHSAYIMVTLLTAVLYGWHLSRTETPENMRS